MNQEKIGKFIYDLRKKYNLTQAELANRLHVTAQAVSKWENGRGVPDIELLKKLSEEFDVSIGELIEGKEDNNKKKKKLGIVIGILFLILVVGVVIFVLLKKDNGTFTFSSLICSNDSFNVSGVIAYDEEKKSIYISNIHYCDEEKEEPKAVAVECVLYEVLDNKEKKIAKYGSLDDKNDNDFISKYLEDIEFNIDDYNCGCNSTTCNNLHIKINALNSDGDIISYDIPLEVNSTCSN